MRAASGARCRKAKSDMLKATPFVPNTHATARATACKQRGAVATRALQRQQREFTESVAEGIRDGRSITIPRSFNLSTTTTAAARKTTAAAAAARDAAAFAKTQAKARAVAAGNPTLAHSATGK
jgi:hypothetical protein